MAEAKQSKKPQDAKLAEGKGGKALGKEGEVGGRGRRVLYTCWRCGAENWVDSDWGYFMCWRDDAICLML